MNIRSRTTVRCPAALRRASLALLLAVSGVRAQPAPDPVPAGVADFTARLARDYWNLFGPEQRPTLDELNRQLRAPGRRAERPDANARRATPEQVAQATEQLLKLVRESPRLLRVNLSAAPPAFEPAGPVALPGDAGALLFEVGSGSGATQFATARLDFSEPAGESSLIAVDVGPSGTTYAVAGLDNVPRGRTTALVEFRRAGQPPVRLPLDVTTPKPGRLRLKVLSDDSGQPAPAMVRLMSRADGRERRPAEGIELAPQFDRQGAASGARAVNLPGLQGMHFWCVPGPFDMALAPGVWQIGVRHGVEHEIVFEDVTIASGAVTDKTIRPQRWVDMRKLGWWPGDDHVHGQILSDGDARRLLAWIQAEDIHLANVVKMGDIYRTYFEQRGFGKAFRFAEGDYVLVPGQECPRTHDQIGHTLAMNISEMVRDTDQYYLYDTVFDAVHAQGGLSGYAHVNSGMFHVHRDMSLNVPRQKVDFVEILQFNTLGTDLYYDFLNLGCKLTASAGSDVPWGGSVGEVRAYAFLGAEPFSADAWFRAFGRGRTFTTSGPMIEFHVDDALPGDELRVQENHRLHVRARAWGDPRRMAPVKLEVVRHGDVLRTAESTESARPEAALDFEMEAGDGCWLAARARAGDGTSAHTTPVYVVKEGLRFWKFAAVDELIAKRLESLQEIERIVAEAQRQEQEGRLGADRTRQQLARQGPALLERVATARRIYDELKATAKREADLRGKKS